MVIDDEKELCCRMCIMGDTLMGVRRMILVIVLNDDFSVIHGFEISAFPPECSSMPCKLIRALVHVAVL